MLHGKRNGDTNWYYHGGHLNRVPGGPEVIDEASSIHNSLSSSTMRAILSGSSPAWTIRVQKKNGTSWDDVYSTSVDLRSHLTGDLDEVALIMSFFVGVSRDKPGVLPAEIFNNSIWGTGFELSQFEPWIIDISDWRQREWDQHWKWLTGSTKSYGIEFDRPKTDLMHSPMGTAAAPEALRESDPELGICMKMGKDSKLVASGISDNRYIDSLVGPEPQPIVVCDADMFGIQAPFAAYARCKLLSVGSWGAERNIFSFGNAYAALPSISDNGIGIYWKPTTGTKGQIVARCFDSALGVIEVTTDDIEADQWSDRQIELGIAWTGDRGLSMGLVDRQFRLVIDGITIDSEVVNNFVLVKTKEMHVGADQTKDGAQMLFRSMTMFGDAVTNYDLNRAFEQNEEVFGNPSYETAGLDNRPGEAYLWNWYSSQAIGAWAEFNSYEATLEQWRTATENFGAGWFDITKWFYDLSETDQVAAVFNKESSSLYSIFELFDFLETTPPWKDDFTLLQPSADVLGYDDGPTGFNGWYDSSYMTNFLPGEREDFGDNFNTDPFSTSAGSMWYPGTSRNGRQFSKAIDFPLLIPPDKNKLVIWVDGAGVLEVSIPTDVYNTPIELCTAINTILSGYYANNEVLFFAAWTDGDESGIQFKSAVSGVPVAAASMFGCREDQRSNDVRGLIGLDSLGYGGRKSEFRATRWMLGDLHGGNSDDIFCLDSWSLLDFITSEDQHLTGMVIEEYGNVAAVFDSETSADKSVLERFTLVGWFGSAAEWQTGYMPSDIPGGAGIVPGMFDGATIAREDFDPVEWPNEIWT